MTPTSWLPTAIVVPVPSGAESGFVSVTVGGQTASFPGPVIGALPTPTSLQITPAGVSMLIGATKQFIVLDNQGLLRYDATWTVDNASLGTITSGSSPTLTALAAGTITLTATVQSVSAQMPVTISSLGSLVNGTILWSAPSLAGVASQQMMQAVPTMFGPDVYSIQSNATQTLVQAFTAEGQEMWQTMLPLLSGNPTPDGSGGIVVTEACDPSNPSGSPMQIVDLDGVSGATLWGTSITSTENACPPGLPKSAVRQDGALIIAAPLQTSPALLVLGGSIVTSAPTIPPSTITDEFGTVSSCDCNSPVGQPIVDSDGSIYVEYEVRQIPYPPTSFSSVLWLMQIGPDGSTVTNTQLSSSDQGNLFPGTLLPDGNGDLLATWTIVPASLPAAPQPFQAAYVSLGSVVNTYALPLAPPTLVIGTNGLPVNPTLALGENGTVFASYGLNIVSFAMEWGSANWNYQSPSYSSAIAAATTDGGVWTNDSQQGLIQLDSGGNASAAVSSILGGTPYTLGRWSGVSYGIGSMFVGPYAYLTQSYPTPGGDPAPTNSHKLIVSTFIPFELSPGEISPEGEITEINKYYLPPTVQHDSFILSNATVPNFQAELQKPIAAIGFLGHSLLDRYCPGGPNSPCLYTYSVGLLLSDGGTASQALVATTSLGTAQYPVHTYANATAVSQIETQAKVVFIAACDIGPVFESLWNIQTGTTNQALIVPVETENDIIIGHTFKYWEQLLNQLTNGSSSVQSAVTYSNAWLLSQGTDIDNQPITEQWQIIGGGNVKIH
jgi:hypothetical protein